MSIYNKDGSVYKLSSANPLMIDQKLWENFVVHNFVWQVKSENYVLPPTRNETFKKEIIEQSDKNFLFEDDLLKEAEKEIPTVIAHCLPVRVQNHEDSLYGDGYQTIQYDNPFMIEIVILQMSTTLEFFFWTKDKISNHSIIYPKTGDKSWWKVVESKEENGGFVIKGIVSDYNPQF